MTEIPYRKILDFWFEDLKPEQWFKEDSALDKKIKEEYSDIHLMATRGELWHWRDSGRGRLAEIIVLDQFSRNIFRNQAQAYSWDSTALALAQEAIKQKVDNDLSGIKKSFLYMPFMHSESLRIHHHALELFSEPGLEFNLEYERKHIEVIKKFGRYPHRNLVLERESSQEEITFLNQNPLGF